MAKEKIVIIIGSGSDEEFAEPICTTLEKYEIPYERRVISAHRRTRALLDELERYEASGDNLIYITVAGLSDSLSGIIAGNTTHPVIACPPYSEKFGGIDVYSSFRTPKGIPTLFVPDPENAALAAIRILSLANNRYREKLLQHRKTMEDMNKHQDETIGKSSAVK